jgi:hypothetical protein
MMSQGYDQAQVPDQDQGVHPVQTPYWYLPPVQVVKQATVPVKTQV